MDDKIDFVITWVDGNDKKWQEEKRKYEKMYFNVDVRENRYRNWDNLKYLFRGIEKYASWVNKVYLITCGHKPEWINENNPKLVLIKHSDYIPKEYLPTFNSNTIELNVNRIKELSENFVLFNDDMFIINKVNPTDFFKKGLPCDSAILSPIISYDKDGFSKTLQNNMAIINTYFDKNKCIMKNFNKWINIKYGKDLFRTICLIMWKHFPGFFDIHMPTSLKKSNLELLWKKEYEFFNQTSLTKFRDNNTNISQWLIRYWQLCNGEFYPRSIKFGRKFQYGKDKKEIYEAIQKSKYKVICLNDIEGDYSFEEEKQKTIEALEKILPEKSSFEK